MFVLIFQCVLVVMRINCQLHAQLQLDLLLVFTLVSVLNGLDRTHVHNDMHAIESLECDQQHCSPCLLCASCWDGSITCTGAVSSVSACCTPCCSCSDCNSFFYLCNFMLFLSCYFITCNSFFVPFFVFARSSCHVVTS